MKYARLPSSDEEQQQRQSDALALSYGGTLVSWWRECMIILLLASTLSLAWHHLRWPLLVDASEAKEASYRLTSPREQWIQYQWNSMPYSSASKQDDDVVDAAWSQIVPAHGFVAIDHDEALNMALPASMDLPSDPSKSVYIIDAYHQLHCVTIIRRTFQELLRGEEPHYPVEHSHHCFDSLKQYITCGSPGDTLLYTWGRNQTGDGQVRKCRDWASMRDWATKHTACYRDTEHGVPLSQHFGHCDNGTDGIQLPER